MTTEGPFRDKPRVCRVCLEPVEGGSICPVTDPNMVFHHGCWDTHYRNIEGVVQRNLRDKMKEDSVKCEYCDKWSDRFSSALTSLFLHVSITGVILAVIGTGLFCLWSTIMASGEVSHCYIESSGAPIHYSLQGYREWRSNNNMGVFNTPEEASKAAETMKCRITKQAEAQ